MSPDFPYAISAPVEEVPAVRVAEGWEAYDCAER